MIGVKNRSKTKLAARFDGKEYEFPADEKVVTPIPEDAAHHIFGYGERDKTRALQRLGWLRAGGHEALAEAEGRLADFQFLAVEMHVKEDADVTDIPRNMRSEGTPPNEAELETAKKTLAKDPKGEEKQFARK